VRSGSGNIVHANHFEPEKRTQLELAGRSQKRGHSSNWRAGPEKSQKRGHSSNWRVGPEKRTQLELAGRVNEGRQIATVRFLARGGSATDQAPPNLSGIRDEVAGD
jgi:hypothetical protein